MTLKPDTVQPCLGSRYTAGVNSNSYFELVTTKQISKSSLGFPPIKKPPARKPVVECRNTQTTLLAAAWPHMTHGLNVKAAESYNRSAFCSCKLFHYLEQIKITATTQAGSCEYSPAAKISSSWWNISVERLLSSCVAVISFTGSIYNCFLNNKAHISNSKLLKVMTSTDSQEPEGFRS